MSLFFIIILGLILGSFANCLIWRLYVNKSLWGRSICPACKHQLAWYDNIPLLSFLLLGANCRYCQRKISWQYFFVELAMTVLFIMAWQFSGDNVFLLIKLCLSIFLLVTVFVFDLKYYLIPINLLLIISPLLYLSNLLSGIVWWQPLFFSLVLLTFFLSLYLITAKKGIGEGDIWLVASLGLVLSTWIDILLLILISSFLGSLVGIILVILKKKKWQSQLPLGVFLALGTIISLFYSDYLWTEISKILI